MIRKIHVPVRWSHPRTQREHTGNQDLMILRRHLNYMAHPCMPLMETSPQIGGLIAIRVQLARTLVTPNVERSGGYVTNKYILFPGLHDRCVLKKKRTFQIITPRKIYDISWVPHNVDSRRLDVRVAWSSSWGNGSACPFHWAHRWSSAFGSYKTRIMTTHPSAAWFFQKSFEEHVCWTMAWMHVHALK